MNTHEFVGNVIKLYHEARILAFPHKKIKRGESRSISSLAEDLFAKFIVEKIKCQTIYVNQPMFIPALGKRKPDIAVVRDNAITAFCDLKTSMGYNREGLYSLCQRHSDWIRKARGKQCTLIDGVTKEKRAYAISGSASYSVVILTDTNINPKLLAEQIEGAARLNPFISIYILTSGAGLNEYRPAQEILKKVKIRQGDLIQLIKQLNT